MHALVKDLPDSIRAALRSVGYARADIDVEVGESFHAPGAYGAGHRGRVLMVNLATGETQYEMGAWGGSNPFSQRPVDEPGGRSALPPGFAALTSGHTKIWHLHLNPANVAAMLPSAGGEVTPREKWILWSMMSLTSAGRKNEYERLGRGAAPSQAELERLAANGFIKVNKAGAASITTAGKNVVGGYGKNVPFVARTAELGTGQEREITAEDLLAPITRKR